MGELLFLAAALFFGIMLCVFTINSAFEFVGVGGLLLLVAAIATGFTIAASSDDRDGRK